MLSKLVQVFCKECRVFQFWKFRTAKDDPNSIVGQIICEDCLKGYQKNSK